MNINRHNCEAVFLDYYEKNLSPVEVAEVLFFLEENPGFKELFESYEAVFLEHEKINFPDKEALKKKYNRKELEVILASGITCNNCEQFFIANAEGILAPSQKEKLHLFLLQYPELQKEARLFEQCRLSPGSVVFEGKAALKKKAITKENREEYFIRAVENDLNASEQKEVIQFLAEHSEFKKEFELFSKTILPTEAILFDDKSSLRKKSRKPVIISIFYQRVTYYAAAAAILLLAGLFFILRKDASDKQLLADKTIPAAIGPSAPPTVNVHRENATPSLKKNTETIVPQIKKEVTNHFQSPTSGSQHIAIKKKTTTVSQQESKEEAKELQPIIVEDSEALIAKEETKSPMMTEENTIAKKQQERENTEQELKTNQEIALVAANKSKEEYQTLGSFARKKLKSALGIKNASACEAEDKLGWWDLAMAAKNGLQNLMGTKAIEVNKVCGGDGNKVEYVFAAGNFEIIKSASR